MEISDSDAVALGDYCETLLQQPSFNLLVQLFEDSVAKTILSTAPNGAEQREAAYATYNGLREFLGQITFLVQRKNEILEIDTPTPSVQDEW